MFADRLSEAAKRPVSRETSERVEDFARLLVEENQRQNLISRASEADLLDRHILDGAQLLRYDEREDARWIDIGTGPGLPGLVIALLHKGPVELIEPRPLRTAFLERMVTQFELGDRVAVHQGKAAAVNMPGDVITARAVASLTKFLDLSHHLSTEKTRWVLPKGRKALAELEEAKRFWQADFRVKKSLTDPDARIIIVERPKRKGRR
ncbi:16S rRNA (guanine(527)-N(7))-methyltransferase RsmG [Sphingomicrobium sediminis]|uniref:Ribosomal RNA small subunit methyltransferase G n=1 Tax=Sphingomicrobium sediminis TaxID=2950949 RepID=A0A9X2EMS9_9SPHN|nr:16S rRNA (guanine(527)-N(7))-methyltransferase RsmG [Sphingomicrobium sediminis]MCM8558077.1 16S rRNA (guanine(527)-N(7))-methyltransferase RsmG [Sphingomicrobium sediminis]